ncbi:MAG: hypothetical protein ACPGUD_12130 [Parashewanella sp.]
MAPSGSGNLTYTVLDWSWRGATSPSLPSYSSVDPDPNSAKQSENDYSDGVSQAASAPPFSPSMVYDNPPPIALHPQVAQSTARTLKPKNTPLEEELKDFLKALLNDQDAATTKGNSSTATAAQQQYYKFRQSVSNSHLLTELAKQQLLSLAKMSFDALALKQHEIEFNPSAAMHNLLTSKWSQKAHLTQSEIAFTELMRFAKLQVMPNAKRQVISAQCIRSALRGLDFNNTTFKANSGKILQILTMLPSAVSEPDLRLRMEDLIQAFTACSPMTLTRELITCQLNHVIASSRFSSKTSTPVNGTGSDSSSNPLSHEFKLPSIPTPPPDSMASSPSVVKTKPSRRNQHSSSGGMMQMQRPKSKENSLPPAPPPIHNEDINVDDLQRRLDELRKR